MGIAFQLELPKGSAGQGVVGTLPKTIGVVKHLNHGGDYDLLYLSVGGSYAPGEPRCRIEQPALYEPLSRPCGLSAAEAASDPEDTLWRHVGDGVIDPPGGGNLSGLYRPLGGENDLWAHGEGLNGSTH